MMSSSAADNCSKSNSIHGELLALLDSERASSCCSLPAHPSHLSNRHNGNHNNNNGNGGGCSQSGDSRESSFGDSTRHSSRSQYSSSLSSRGDRGDRSLPPMFKYWSYGNNNNSNNNNNNAKQSKQQTAQKRKRSESNKGGAEGGFVQRIIQIPLNCYDRVIRLAEIELGWLHYFVLVMIGMGIFSYAKTTIQSNSRMFHFHKMNMNPFSSLRLGGGGASDGMMKVAPRAQFSFIDSAWRGEEEVHFETLIPPSEIDFSIQRRMNVEEVENCDDLLLYIPRTINGNGKGGGGHDHASELNGYLLAALLATYLDKAMVVLEAPMPDNPDPKTRNNWFDCPIDTFEKDFVLRDGNGENSEFDPPTTAAEEEFPSGLSRLIQHPSWLSRKCPVPCQASYDYPKWNQMSTQRIQHVTCQNDNDRKARVFVVGAEDIHDYFERQWKFQMLSSQEGGGQSAAYDWALRLGAKGHEAGLFAGLKGEEEIWEYVSALMARSGVVRFQPWIARDVKALIESTGLPLIWPYFAIYAHEGDDSVDGDGSDGTSPPMKELAFRDYLKQFDVADCNPKAHHVYVATDNPHRIEEEIERLPKGSGGNTILRECHKMKFIFSPVVGSYNNNLLKVYTGMDCAELHRTNIASIADLMIMAKSDTFVGELNSPFGRLVRLFRTAVNDFPGRGRDGAVLVRNTRVASGRASPGPPWL